MAKTFYASKRRFNLYGSMNPFTYSISFNCTDYSSDRFLTNIWGGTGLGQGISFVIVDNGKIRLSLYYSDGHQISSSDAITIGKDYHLIITGDKYWMLSVRFQE